MTSRRRLGSLLVALASAAAAAACATLLLVDAGPAHAVPPETVAVSSDRGLSPEFAGFSPGHIETWRIDATPGSRALLELRVEPRGALATADGGLALTVATCRDYWTVSSSCAGRRVLLAKSPLASAALDDGLDIGRLDAGRTVHLQLVFAMSDTAQTRTDDALMGLDGGATVRVVASGISAGESGTSGGSAGGQSGSGGGGAGGAGSAGSGGASGAGGAAATGGDGARDGLDPGARGSDLLGDGRLAWTGTTKVGAAVLGGSALLLGGVVLLARRRGARR